MVPEGDGLGGLQMSEAGHDGLPVALRQIQQGAQQGVLLGEDGVDFLAQVEARGGGDLIIARTPGVQLLAGIADPLDQPMLDVHVQVFQVHPPLKLAGLDLFADLPQAGDDALHFAFFQNAGAAQHAAMGDGAANVLAIEPPVESHGGRELLHEAIRGFPQPSTGELGTCFHGRIVPARAPQCPKSDDSAHGLPLPLIPG